MGKDIHLQHKDLINSFNKNADILKQHLIIKSDNPSPQDIWYSYSKCSKEELDKLVKRGDTTALLFNNCKMKVN